MMVNGAQQYVVCAYRAERDYIAGQGSFVRAIANFICERGF